MFLACQMSLYPLGKDDYTAVIKEAVAALGGSGVEVEVNAMSTIIRGEEETVWQAARRLFQTAAGCGEVVMVMTVSNRCGCKTVVD